MKSTSFLLRACLEGVRRDASLRYQALERALILFICVNQSDPFHQALMSAPGSS